MTRPRTILAALLLAGVALGPRCAGTPHPGPLPNGERESAALHPDPLSASGERQKFQSSVRPVLSTRCAPCHEPGGKMYARLPFDDPKVVSANATAMLRRLKGDDRAAFERWAAGLAAATPTR